MFIHLNKIYTLSIQFLICIHAFDFFFFFFLYFPLLTNASFQSRNWSRFIQKLATNDTPSSNRRVAVLTRLAVRSLTRPARRTSHARPRRRHGLALLCGHAVVMDHWRPIGVAERLFSLFFVLYLFCYEFFVIAIGCINFNVNYYPLFQLIISFISYFSVFLLNFLKKDVRISFCSYNHFF